MHTNVSLNRVFHDLYLIKQKCAGERRVRYEEVPFLNRKDAICARDLLLWGVAVCVFPPNYRIEGSSAVSFMADHMDKDFAHRGEYTGLGHKGCYFSAPYTQRHDRTPTVMCMALENISAAEGFFNNTGIQTQVLDPKSDLSDAITGIIELFQDKNADIYPFNMKDILTYAPVRDLLSHVRQDSARLE